MKAMAEARNLPASPLEVVDDQKLDHQRRAPDHPHHETGQQAQRPEPAHGAQRYDQPQGDRAQSCDEKQPQRLQKAHVQGLEHGGHLL